jgi:hypothetical protein
MLEPRPTLKCLVAAADEAIVILLSTASADTTIRLNRLREEFSEASKRAHRRARNLKRCSPMQSIR